jgi:hypothetical protein
MAAMLRRHIMILSSRLVLSAAIDQVRTAPRCSATLGDPGTNLYGNEFLLIEM